MSEASWLMCLLCYLVTTGKWATYSQATTPYHTNTTAPSGLTSSGPSLSTTNHVSQEMIFATNSWESTAEKDTILPRNVSDASGKSVHLTERWETTTIRHWSETTDTAMQARTTEPMIALFSTVPVNSTNGIREDTLNMELTLIPTSPTFHSTKRTFSSSHPMSPSAHLTSSSQTTVDWLSTYRIPNVSVQSCFDDCQCSAESLFDAYARAFFQLAHAKPALYQGLSSFTFTDFRTKLLAPHLASSMGKAGFIEITTTNKAYATCSINETQWVVDESFERHFSGLDLTKTTLNLTLHCASAATTVIWASNNITLDSLTVDGCSHIVQNDPIKTAEVFSKLFVTNSSEEWIDAFKLANTTKVLWSIDIRGTRLSQLPGIFYSDVPLRLNTLRLQNVSLRRLDCTVMSNFTGMTTLDLSQNGLIKIEDCFLPASMESLNVSYNNIYDLSALEFPRFVRGFNVTMIDLCGNQIAALRPFTKMNVAFLSLCKNSIETIQQLTFLQLSNLYHLDLSWNKISTIEPGAFRFLYDIQFLDLSHNHLVSLEPETSPGVPCNIDISYNRFHHPAFSSRNFETITALELRVHHNPYYCDCDLPKLQEFVAQGQNKELYKRMQENLNIQFIFNKTYPEQLFSPDDLRCAQPENLRGQRMVDVVFNGSCPVVDNCPIGCGCINNHVYVLVDCAFRKLTSLPDVMPNELLHLDFHHNNISTLSIRDYLSRTQVLNLSGNAVAEISSGVFDHLVSIHAVDLTHNALQTLPDDLQQVSFSNASGFLLSENPWRCDCDTLWMSEWLRTNAIVTDAGDTRCQFPVHLRDRQVITVTSDDLNCDITSYYHLAVAFGVLGLIVLICIPVLYHFRLETRVLLHAKFHIRPFDGRVKNLEDNLYDTFISYSNRDSAWVTDTLLPRLEKHRPPFKVCIHQRDFVIGEAISDNITQAITTSHATVMVISEHFAESEWCMFEFQRAHHEMLQDSRRRLLAVIVGDVDVDGLPMDLKTYLKTNTYLSVDDRWFWPKLLYALPDPPSRAGRDEFCMEVYSPEPAMFSNHRILSPLCLVRDYTYSTMHQYQKYAVVCLLLVSAAAANASFWDFLNPSAPEDFSGNSTCPDHCTCQTSSIVKFFEKFFQENDEKIGRRSRPEIDKVLSSLFQGLKRNVFFQIIFGSGLLMNMTCDAVDNDTSLDTLLAESPGLFVLASITCAEKVTLDFDSYPSSVILFSLKISGCTLKSSSVPFKFPVYTLLQVLELNNVNVEWLKTLDISNLNYLISLKINYHNLGQLPVLWTNSSLNSLSFLDLSHNALTEFRCEIGWGLTWLFVVNPTIDTINLEDNLLSEIPRCLLERKLKIPYISLARNKITNTSVFREVESYISTWNLNLRQNHIGSVDSFMFSNMSALDFSQNRIKSIGINSFRCKDQINLLQSLNLSHNQINHIEYGSLDFTPILNYLDLSHNKLKTFDLEFSPSYNRNITMDLRGNLMKYPPFANIGYFAPPAIKTFAANNNFVCDCSIYRFVSIYSQLTASSNSSNAHFQGLRLSSRPFFDAEQYRCEKPGYLRMSRIMDLPVEGKTCPVVEACPSACTCERNEDFIAVHCQEKGLTELPDKLPDGVMVKLNMRDNALKRVDYRSYFKWTIWLDLSHNRINTISVSAMLSLLELDEVFLHSNDISELPSAVSSFLNVTTMNMSLGGNPWNCSCESAWMKTWLVDMGARVLDPRNVLCVGGILNGQMFRDIEEEILNCDQERHAMAAIAFGIVLSILVLVAGVVYWKRLEIKILLYSRLQWGCLKKDNSRGDLLYDVFVSFSQLDYEWIVHTLAPNLEDRAQPYKLCLHQRDFPVGEPIAESIARAVENSRCTLMMVTPNFLESEWCMYEFKTAHQRVLSKDCKVVMILDDKVSTRGMDKTMAAYVKTYTYIKFKDRLFWEKLLYALPKPREQ
ncbi:LOW QUALITY PROTEIN: uncharacterized protein LOC135472843 [Liolophura sinensis]|uniref:LOW QUALITY PROTEIN: uncharacterized protein LOC135472843 n=1 Tax=Liolophura sinensis TaxID=3198878 RepID=UPI0031583CCF